MGSIQSKTLLLNMSFICGKGDRGGREGPEIICCKVCFSSNISLSTWQWISEEAWLGCWDFLVTLLPRLLLQQHADVPFTCKLYREILCEEARVLPTLSCLQPCWWVQQSDHILFLFLIKPDTGFVTVSSIWMGHTCLSRRLKLTSLSDHMLSWNRIVLLFSTGQTTVIKSLQYCLATEYSEVLLKIQGCIELRSVWNLFPACCVVHNKSFVIATWIAVWWTANKGRPGNVWMKIHPWVFTTEVPGLGFLRMILELRFNIHDRFNFGKKLWHLPLVFPLLSTKFLCYSSCSVARVCPTSQSLQSCTQRKTCGPWGGELFAWGHFPPGSWRLCPTSTMVQKSSYNNFKWIKCPHW